MSRLSSRPPSREINSLRERLAGVETSSALRPSPARALDRRQHTSEGMLDRVALSNVRTSLVASLEDDVRRLRAETAAHRHRSDALEALLKEALEKLEIAQSTGAAALVEKRAAAEAEEAAARLASVQEKLLASEAREAALDEELERMRVERSNLAKRLGAAEQAMATVTDGAKGEAAEAEAALLTERSRRIAAEENAAQARRSAEQVAIELEAERAAILAARAALAEARGAESDVRAECEALRAQLQSAAAARSRSPMKEQQGSHSAGPLDRGSSAAAGMSALKAAHRSELARLQERHQAELAAERAHKAVAEKKAAAASARVTKLAAELAEAKRSGRAVAVRASTPGGSEVSSGGSLAAALPAPPPAAAATAAAAMDTPAASGAGLVRADSTLRMEVAKAEARARDFERRLADATKAREDASRGRAAAEREALTLRNALRLAEEQLKAAVPQFGKWSQASCSRERPRLRIAAAGG